MMTFYGDLQNDITPVFSEYGCAITLHRITEGAYDALTGETGTASETDVVSVGVIKEYSTGAIDGTIVKMGDKKLMLPGNIAMAPQPGDQITLPDGVWFIPPDSPGAVQTTAPGGVPLVYTVRIRQ